MAHNKLEDVRDILIASMEELVDGKVSPERMEELKQINYIGKTLVESAKAEATFIGAAAKYNNHSGQTEDYESSFVQQKKIAE